MALNVFFPLTNISQTATRLVVAADPGKTERLAILGSGFKYDDRGVLTSGTITGLQYFIGTKLYQSVTIPNYSAAKLYTDILSKADGLLQQLEGWNLADYAQEPSVSTATQLRFSVVDGTSLQLLGTFDPNDPGSGTVTALRQILPNGTVVETATGFPMPTKTALLALVPWTTVFDAVTSGANTVRAANDGDTHFLDGGAGNDTLIGSASSASDYVEYGGAKAAVIVNLLSGKSAGGGGNDTLISIESVEGSRFSDVIFGNNVDNVVRAGAGNDKVLGLGGRDLIYGHTGADTIDGGSGNDIITGEDQNDTLIGFTGDDSLDGGKGHDTLSGGAGGDTYTGGEGRDLFVFNTAPVSTSIDSIFDFVVADDTVGLDDAVFTSLGIPTVGNRIAAGAFWSNDTGQAHDADDRIIVRDFIGMKSFYYDPDGTGTAASVRVASFSLGVTGTLTNLDFMIV